MISKHLCQRWIQLLVVIFLGQSCGPVTPVTSTFQASTIPPASMPVISSSRNSTSTEVPTISPGSIDLSQMIVEEWASTSPDGKWIAAGLVAFPKANASEQSAYVRLLIFSADGNTLWRIIDERQEIGLGFPVPAPLKWSEDGQHFYFSHRVVPDGCSVFKTFSDLQRVNLQDGNVEELLPQTGRALALAMSPDESMVAYPVYGDRGLVVRDLSTGAERDIPIDPGEDFQAGNIVWSPDDESLALTLAIHPCSGNYPSKTVSAESTSIVLVNAQTLAQKVLIQEDPRLLVTVEWKELNRIVITDGAENSLLYLNVDSGEISRE